MTYCGIVKTINFGTLHFSVVQYYIILTFLFFAGFTVTSNYTVTIHHQTTTNYNPFDTKSVFNLNSLTVAETKNIWIHNTLKYSYTLSQHKCH